jgi:hypothetical protein
VAEPGCAHATGVKSLVKFSQKYQDMNRAAANFPGKRYPGEGSRNIIIENVDQVSLFIDKPLFHPKPE